MSDHKSGYVNIIGSPNVGKSTLMNQLVGEKISIVTSKAQTTRHRILGIVNEEDYQVVFSDTPGVVNSSYKLHDAMMSFVNTSLIDADIILFITDPFEKETNHTETLEKIKLSKVPVVCMINKIDLVNQKDVTVQIDYWQKQLPEAIVFPISALHIFNIEKIWNTILDLLPVNPPYYGKDDLTDRPLKFFIAELIREKIFEYYKKEVPYSCEVEVESFKEEEEIIKIRAIIHVERDSQRMIIIGRGGHMLKRIGTSARKDMERFLGKKVYLETYVKVDKDWRSNDSKLKKFGYKH
jgi:GTP-binding protein Era